VTAVYRQRLVRRLLTMTASRIALAAAIPAALLLTACGSTHAPSSRHAPPAAAPAPTRTAAAIPATRADRSVCRHLLNQEQDAKGANRFMAWAMFGRGRRTANRSSGRLIDAAVKWYDDAYQSWGNPADVSADWADALELCESAGVSG
jgi:hypothetical protein